MANLYPIFCRWGVYRRLEPAEEVYARLFGHRMGLCFGGDCIVVGILV
jgi:hypothetical protein